MKNKIIDVLRGQEGYFSGEEISRRLKTSRAVVWKNIEELRKDGYVIEAVSHHGYHLKSLPDKLYAQEIQTGLKTRTFGHSIVHFESVDSTMNQAVALAMTDAGEGTVICAETQTRGRGRMGRSWISPKGKGVYFSLILKPSFAPTEVAKLTLMSAVAISQAVTAVTGLQPRIKWPNDLLLDGKKVAGILTEMNAEMDRVRFVVVGIGINVNTSAAGLPDFATSLKKECGKPVSRLELTREILRRMEYWYTYVQKNGFKDVLTEWKGLSLTLGRRIQLDDGRTKIEGEAVDLDEFGGLVIRNDAGQVFKRMSGDVVLVQGA